MSNAIVRNSKFLDITGRKFGRLLVESLKGRDRGHIVWNCLCDCGNQMTCTTGRLTSGNTKSCGCVKREVTGNLNRTHGMSKTHPDYEIWKGMIKRCENQAHKDFHLYGGRGIRVCDRWRNSFENFIADMGDRPSARHSIDRRESDGHYEPSNCRWATPVTQARNRSSVVTFTKDGKTQCLSAWSEELGIPYRTLQMRIKRGWDFELAVSAPIAIGQKVRNKLGA